MHSETGEPRFGTGFPPASVTTTWGCAPNGLATTPPAGWTPNGAWRAEPVATANVALVATRPPDFAVSR